jgi:hypothetical protein
MNLSRLNILLGLALGAYLGLIAQRSIAEDPRYILFYGNSFTNATCCGSSKSVPALISEIAVAAFHPAPLMTNASVNGQSLQWHLTTPSQLSKITSISPSSEKWDNVVLQDFSTWPTHIGNLPQHISSSLALYQKVAQHSPNVVPVMYQTWARGYGNAFYTGGSPSFPGGPTQMQQELRNGYQLSANNINANVGSTIARIAPAGDAWELANFPANFYGDGTYHASNRGSLLNALVLYGTIYGDHTTSDINLASTLRSLSLNANDGAYLTSLADAVLATVPEPNSIIAFGIAGMFFVLQRSRSSRTWRQ